MNNYNDKKSKLKDSLSRLRESLVYSEEMPPKTNLSTGNQNPRKYGWFFFIKLFCVSLFLLLIGIAGLFKWYDSKEQIIYDDYDKILEPIIQWAPSDNTLIKDRNGSVISEEFSRFHKYVQLGEMPDFLIKSVIAIEDRRYFQHQGFDVYGTLRATWSAINHMTMARQGGSTITQQLVRNFTLTNEKTIKRKLREIFLAIQLEKRLSKEKILEIYLNQLFLGNGSYGVGAAARRYFDKDLSELNQAEMALIAGLFQSPSYYNPDKNLKAALGRQRQVLKALVRAKVLSADEAMEIKQIDIEITPWSQDRSDKNLWFSNFVVSEAKKILGIDDIKNLGLIIDTTLDASMQSVAFQAVNDHSSRFDQLAIPDSSQQSEKMELQAAFLAVDPRNGHIMAMIGGRDPDASDFNRTSQSLRSPGSLFKPVVYSLALDSGFNWSDVFYVSPVQLPGNYRPKNPTSDYFTETTMMRAFYRSMNAPTLEIAERLGMDKIMSHAKLLGINSPIKKEFGSVLGQSELTMLEVAQLYGNFANRGINFAPVAVTKISNHKGETLYELPTQEERARTGMSPETAFLMFDGLKKVLQLGTASRASKYSRFAGGKTGTTNDSKDNWFAGVTSDLVSVAWVGFDQPKAIEGDAQGATLALPIWESFMDGVRPYIKNQAPDAPEGLVFRKIHPEFGNPSDSGIEVPYRSDDQAPQESGSLEVLSKLGSSFRGFGTR